MTLHEELAIGVQAIELEKQGKFEEAIELERSIPLLPWMAKWAKKRLSADFLIESGYNLSDADAEFGPGWLEKGPQGTYYKRMKEKEKMTSKQL